MMFSSACWVLVLFSCVCGLGWLLMGCGWVVGCCLVLVGLHVLVIVFGELFELVWLNGC